MAMTVKILLPTALRPFADRREFVELEGRTVGEALDALTKKYSELGKHLLDEQGRLRNFVNVYLNDDDVRTLQGPETPIKDGDSLLIVPAIAGGGT